MNPMKPDAERYEVEINAVFQGKRIIKFTTIVLDRENTTESV